jgi:hypothetical protein
MTEILLRRIGSSVCGNKLGLEEKSRLSHHWSAALHKEAGVSAGGSANARRMSHSFRRQAEKEWGIFVFRS